MATSLFLTALSHLSLYLLLSPFQWSCTIASMDNFSSECGLFNTMSTSTSRLIVPPNALSLSVTYAFHVAVTPPSLSSSGERRMDSKIVRVTPLPGKGAIVRITANTTRFNPKAKLVINGLVSASFAVTSSWHVYDSMGVLGPLNALTPITRSFNAVDVFSSVTYPLSVAAGVFKGGKQYTFRLLASTAEDTSAESAFSEITLTANSPPTGGYVVTEPPSGDALSTPFLLSTPGWATDVTCYPLSYSFTYRLSKRSLYLSLASSSLRSFTIAPLPAGLSSLNGHITVQAEAMDIFESSDVAVSTVQVLEGSANVSEYLSSSLLAAFLSGDKNKVFQAVNNVSQSVTMGALCLSLCTLLS